VTNKKHSYNVYLLRCWKEGETTPGQDPHWRFSVEEILQKQPRQGFDSLEALTAFLQASFGDDHQEH
jgi:hypothetical protein